MQFKGSTAMIDVTDKNFENVLPDVMKCIENASFIAMDTEFTGLPSGHQKSLFDSLEERYEKLRQELREIIIIQFGLTIFTKDTNKNRYNANVFTFFLRPHYFGSVDKHFSLQGSALKFLYKYNFDFNKSFRDGVQYLTEEEAQVVQQEIKRKCFMHSLNCDFDRDRLLEVCSKISQWMINSIEDKMYLEEPSLTGIDDYIIFNVVREKIQGCWIYRDEDNKLIVEKVTLARRKDLEFQNVPQEDTKCFENILGFSRVFRKIVECKKPLIGHNCLCDLMLIYQQFHRSLPHKLKVFQDNLLKLFPVIFDTKHMCLLLKKDIEDLIGLENGDLSKTYNTLFSSPISTGLYYSPDVRIPDHNSIEIMPHHAGFDSYASGFIFIKLAHIMAVKKLEGRPKPMTWVEHLDALAPFQNRINLIRSGDHFLDLSRGGNHRARPKWLYIKSVTTSLNIQQVTDLLSSYGTVDVKPLGHNSAALAVGNIACARDIVRAFQQSPDYHVSSYSPLRHSLSGRLVLWSTMACCAGFSVALVVQLVKLAR